MKLCFVIYSLGNGGAERVLTTLANYFSDKHSVSIVTFNDEKSFYPLYRSINVHSIHGDANSKNIPEALKNNFQNILKLKRIIEQEKPDVIISFLTTSNIVSILAAKLANIPVIVSERSNYDFLSSKIWQMIRKTVYPLADHLVVQSQYDLQKYSFVKNRSIIQNPLFFDETQCTKKEKIILAAGRLDYIKGFDLLIEAYSKLQTDWKLLIVGEGAERKKLEQIIKDKKLKDKIQLPGRSENMFEYYSKASIFALSSRMEGFPNVLVEAMACGCAVVAFDCKTGPSEIIEHGVNGLLVQDGNVDALSESIQLLLEDEDLRHRLGSNAVTIQKKLSKDSIASQWLEVIQSVKKR